MRHVTLALSLFGLLAAGAIAVPEKPLGVAAGSNAFGFDLYGRLRTQPGNVFISPVNIATALAISANGARGQTQEEILRALHLDQVDNAGYAALQQQLQAGPNAGYQLSVATALWGQDGFPIQQPFVDALEKHFRGGMQRVDFRNATAAVEKVNQWAAAQTQGRIRDLLTADNISPLTRLVLTSAIYFKGDWQYKFNKQATRPEPFWLTAERSTNVPLMHESADVGYFADDQVQLVELPYKGNRLSMVVVLPRDKDGLKKLEETLNASKLDGWLAKLSKKPGDITLPRFEFTTRYTLPDQLKALGMTRAFANNADFSGITTAEPLRIADVIHQTFVRVDEEGSEAAAATAIIYDKAPSPVIERFDFRADHPFVFLIRDKQTGAILFLGRMSEPAK